MKNELEKVLITGGCGFIGSHTSAILLKQGYQVVIIDSNLNSSPKTIERISEILLQEGINTENRISFYRGDLLDASFVEKVFELEESLGNPIGYVIHFAGLKSVNESTISPLIYWDTNLVSTINLLKAMQINNCKNIIFSSSATVYQKQNIRLIKESDNLNPVNPYGNTKLSIEKLLKDIFVSDATNWRIACLRYFNPIGAHPSGLLGEDPSGSPNNIFPLINNVALKQKEFLEVYGNDWNTIDGTCIRDYIHVMDLSEAHVRTLDLIKVSEPKYLIMNIGTGIGTSVLELIKTYEEVNNLKIPFKIAPRRKGDLEVVVADNSYSYSLLNWKPKLDLKDMCRDGWKWKIQNPSGYVR